MEMSISLLIRGSVTGQSGFIFGLSSSLIFAHRLRISLTSRRDSTPSNCTIGDRWSSVVSNHSGDRPAANDCGEPLIAEGISLESWPTGLSSEYDDEVLGGAKSSCVWRIKKRETRVWRSYIRGGS